MTPMPDPQRLTVPRDQLRNAGLHLAMNELRAGNPPLPLPRGQADAQALRLRMARLSYGAIQHIMATYHGEYATEDAWRRRLRKAGAPPNPRGRPLNGREWRQGEHGKAA